MAVSTNAQSCIPFRQKTSKDAAGRSNCATRSRVADQRLLFHGHLLYHAWPRALRERNTSRLVCPPAGSTARCFCSPAPRSFPAMTRHKDGKLRPRLSPRKGLPLERLLEVEAVFHQAQLGCRWPHGGSAKCQSTLANVFVMSWKFEQTRDPALPPATPPPASH